MPNYRIGFVTKVVEEQGRVQTEDVNVVIMDLIVIAVSTELDLALAQASKLVEGTRCISLYLYGNKIVVNRKKQFVHGVFMYREQCA